MFRAGMGCILAVVWVGAAYGAMPPGFPVTEPVDSVTLNQLSVNFGPGGVGSTLSLDGHGIGSNNTTVYFPTNPQYDFESDYDLDTTLLYEWSVDPHTEGWFENGPLSLVYDDGDPLTDDELLIGTVVYYHLGEIFDTGVLSAIALLNVTGGLWVDAGLWPVSGGSSMSSISFNLQDPLNGGGPYNPSNLLGPFEGSATVNMYPDQRAIPEPATLLLLAGGLAALRRRK